jgi:hypothetical protein
MICRECNSNILPDSVYCSVCGIRIITEEPKKLPQMLTVQEAVKDFFQGKFSAGKLYDLVKKHEIPHKRMSTGKILFDEDALIEWWNAGVKRSTEKPKLVALRRID